MKQPNKTQVNHLTPKIVILLGAVAILTLIIQLLEPIQSHDIWWHIVLGKNILESGSLIVDHSLFSWTPAISYFVYNSWLSEVILYLIDQYLGIGGLIGLRYIVFLGIVALACHFSIKRGIISNPLTWPIILISLSFMWGSALIKPELFTLGFMSIVVWLYYYIRFKGDNAWYLPYLYPALFVLWANMHGAFFVSSLFFISAVGGEFLNLRFSPSQAMPSKLRIHFLTALVLCIPAILITPYGYEFPIKIIHTILFGAAVAQDNIIGYQPTFLLNASPLFLLDYLIASMLLFVFLIWQKLKIRHTDWVAIIAYIAYSILFIQMGRVTLYLGSIFLFTGLDLLAHKERSWAWPSSTWGKFLITLLSITIVITIAGRAIYAQRYELAQPISLINKVFDTSTDTLRESADYVEANLSGNKIGNEYDTGGYLMYRFWPNKKTMIDSRTFPFPDWIDQYFEMEHGNRIEGFLNINKADFWVISYERAVLISWFATSKDWSLVFIGPNGAVFVPYATNESVVEVSDKIDTLDNLPGITKILPLAFLRKDPILARRIYDAAAKNMCMDCGINEIYMSELDNTVTGMELFSSGDYREAADKWKTPGQYLQSRGNAANALMKLAESEWEKGNLGDARKTYIEILNLFSEATIVDAYNFALIDWQYRYAANDRRPSMENTPHWKPIVDAILEKQKMFPNEQNPITKTAREMKAGTYNGSAKMLPRNYKLNLIQQ